VEEEGGEEGEERGEGEECLRTGLLLSFFLRGRHGFDSLTVNGLS
jgi:hypothetical protein